MTLKLVTLKLVTLKLVTLTNCSSISIPLLVKGMKKYKVAIIGESDVGKSSLLMCFQHGYMDPNGTSTMGAAFSTKKMWLEEEKETVSLEIWDTAGQERFHSIIPMYFKDAAAILLVYDVTNTRSSDALKRRWFETIRAIFPKRFPVIAIVGNKVDLVPLEERAELSAVINDLCLFFDNYAIPHFTSAATGENVQQLFIDITNHIHLQKSPKLRKSVLRLQEELEPEPKRSRCC